MSSVCVEGGLRFTFDGGACEHIDKSIEQRRRELGVTTMKSVDFMVDFETHVWFIEVKDPDNPQIPLPKRENYQGYAQKDIEFFQQIVCSKLASTFQYLTLDGRPPIKPITYFLLIAQETLTDADLDNLTDKMRKACLVPTSRGRQWKSGFNTFVLNLEAWNSAFPQHKIERISNA